MPWKNLLGETRPTRAATSPAMARGHLREEESLPQIVDDVIRTIASVGAPITGSGADSHALWPRPW